MNYQDHDMDQLTLRDHLALDRTRLANERTSLAYLRTAMVFAVSGVSIIELFPSRLLMQATGWLLLPIAVVFFVLAIYRFVELHRRLAKVGSRSETASKDSE